MTVNSPTIEVKTPVSFTEFSSGEIKTTTSSSKPFIVQKLRQGNDINLEEINDFGEINESLTDITPVVINLYSLTRGCTSVTLNNANMLRIVTPDTNTGSINLSATKTSCFLDLDLDLKAGSTFFLMMPLGGFGILDEMTITLDDIGSAGSIINFLLTGVSA